MSVNKPHWGLEFPSNFVNRDYTYNANGVGSNVARSAIRLSGRDS